MPQRLRTVFAEVSCAATLVAGCGSSADQASQPSATPVYEQASCQDMQIAPTQHLGVLSIKLVGTARVPADYGVVVSEVDDNNVTIRTKAGKFAINQAMSNHTASGDFNFLDIDPNGGRFDIVGVVAPTGYDGPLYATPDCHYKYAVAPNK